ncbi:MAG: hypothetical protein J4415_00535 [Candidatus Diapherotrites archaeon]|uniref:Uncharacterized protein n=1 Tax=Candidatus Iainarchaeum sp. TaxID=3101447 RepID=A0A8T4KZI0_9ARCH|nr:hypothetical protein [Candidatus Diapherotrites archaeon]
MTLFDPQLELRLIFVFGILNIVGIALVLLSCRCLFARLINPKSSIMMKFYNLHCYYWLLFLISVLAHALIAFDLLGIPK